MSFKDMPYWKNAALNTAKTEAQRPLKSEVERLRAELALVKKERDDARNIQKIMFVDGQLSGRVEGAAEERAHIVAWLNSIGDEVLVSVADEIADGNHIKESV